MNSASTTFKSNRITNTVKPTSSLWFVWFWVFFFNFQTGVSSNNFSSDSLVFLHCTTQKMVVALKFGFTQFVCFAYHTGMTKQLPHFSSLIV